MLKKMKNRTSRKDAVTHSIVDRPTVRLSDPSMKSRIDTMITRLQQDPTVARSLLREAGIVTPKGKLSKKSGG
jgi:hypothetical protein